MVSQVSGVRLAERQEAEIAKLVEVGFYISTSEFIREAVREKLENIGEKTIPDEIAEKEIRWFLKQKKGSGENTISIVEICQELMLPPVQIEKIMAKIKGAVEL